MADAKGAHRRILEARGRLHRLADQGGRPAGARRTRARGSMEACPSRACADRLAEYLSALEDVKASNVAGQREDDDEDDDGPDEHADDDGAV